MAKGRHPLTKEQEQWRKDGTTDKEQWRKDGTTDNVEWQKDDTADNVQWQKDDTTEKEHWQKDAATTENGEWRKAEKEQWLKDSTAPDNGQLLTAGANAQAIVMNEDRQNSAASDKIIPRVPAEGSGETALNGHDNGPGNRDVGRSRAAVARLLHGPQIIKGRHNGQKHWEAALRFGGKAMKGRHCGPSHWDGAGRPGKASTKGRHDRPKPNVRVRTVHQP